MQSQIQTSENGSFINNMMIKKLFYVYIWNRKVYLVVGVLFSLKKNNLNNDLKHCALIFMYTSPNITFMFINLHNHSMF